jgi:hypothetical protein
MSGVISLSFSTTAFMRALPAPARAPCFRLPSWGGSLKSCEWRYTILSIVRTKSSMNMDT